MTLESDSLDWSKGDGLIPAVVQHWRSGRVLMLGYMNRDAVAQTLQSGKVTFFSRSRQRLWMKGETSGHVLEMRSMHADCDGDTLLVLAEPSGPTCHRGTESCFTDAAPSLAILSELDDVIASRERERPAGRYTTTLFDAGVRRIAQKVGEEGLETALAAVAQDQASIASETADLLYHVLVLLRARDVPLAEVAEELRRRRG